MKGLRRLHPSPTALGWFYSTASMAMRSALRGYRDYEGSL
jgi:hypothetical protein